MEESNAKTLKTLGPCPYQYHNVKYSFCVSLPANNFNRCLVTKD